MLSSSSRSLSVVAIAGSLRSQSLNRRLLEAARGRAPDMLVTLAEGLGDIPVFNEDLETDGGPAAVRRLCDDVARAGAVIIATPEYNQSIPGPMKNIIDWLSRSEPAVLESKPVALIGASAGPWGTRLAQAGLRQTLTACGALVMGTPQLYLRNAAEAFDSAGALTDARAAAQLDAVLEAFRAWVLINAEARAKEATA